MFSAVPQCLASQSNHVQFLNFSRLELEYCEPKLMTNRLFCILMFSAHGTFLGHIRLEPHKPQQIPIDSTVSFGASTRAYTLREKPQTLPSAVKGDEKMGGEDEELKGLLGLPEEETELDVSTMAHCT